MDNIDYPCRTALHLDSNRYVAVRHMVECNDGVTYLAASHASPAIAQAVGGGLRCIRAAVPVEQTAEAQGVRRQRARVGRVGRGAGGSAGGRSAGDPRGESR